MAGAPHHAESNNDAQVDPKQDLDRRVRHKSPSSSRPPPSSRGVSVLVWIAGALGVVGIVFCAIALVAPTAVHLF